MNTNESYENSAVIIVLSGCGAAIFVAAIILICCHLFIKPKNRSSYYSSRRNYTLERQTTTSDDNNGEIYSCCVEEYMSQSHEVDESDDEKTISPKSPKQKTETILQDKETNEIAYQVRFTPNEDNIKNPEQQAQKQGPLDDNIPKSLSGITRQQSFDDSDIENDAKLKMNTDFLANLQNDAKLDVTPEKSPETVRREYRELWQLRTTFENEEQDGIEEERIDSNNSDKVIPTSKFSDYHLTKYDSGYRSIERRDYSIDSKAESIYRQFISNSIPSRKSHQSIQEEQESEAFV